MCDGGDRRDLASGTPAAADTTWLQWGGRIFVVDSPGLASSWPASGPPKIWSRDLGEGHSAIVADGGRLYTMYRSLGMLSMIRRSQQEIVTAIDATNGRTIWEYAIDSRGRRQHLQARSCTFVTGSR